MPVSNRLIDLFLRIGRPAPGRAWRILGLLLVLLAPILALDAYVYSQTSRAITEALLLRTQATVAAPMAAALEERLDRIAEFGTSFSTHSQVRQAIMEGKWTEAIGLLQTFRSVTNEPFIDRIFIADLNGILRAGWQETGTEGQDFSHRDWYQGAVSRGGPYVSTAYKRAVEPRLNVATVAVPIRDDRGALVAIVALQFKTDNILQWASAVETPPGQFIYIVDQAGQVVAHPLLDPQEPIVNIIGTPVARDILAGRSGVDIGRSTVQEDTVVSVYTALSGAGWGLVVEEPHSSFFASRDSSLQRLLLIYAVALAVIILLFCLGVKIVDRLRQAEEIRRPS